MKERIDEGIYRFRATEEPLSADVGVIEGKGSTWLFDVGSSEAHLEAILSIPGEKTVVLSHFHPDHTGNIGRLSFRTLYAGRNTLKYTGGGTAVEGEITVEDGHLFRIIPFPSVHAKGSVALEVDEKYLFTGDGLDAAMKGGRIVYNAGMLLDDIRLLERLKADRVLLSHEDPFCVPKEQVLDRLKRIYSLRVNGEPYITVSQ